MTYTLVPADAVLSGNLACKNAVMLREAVRDDLFERTQQRMEALLPKPIAFPDIDFGPHSFWVPRRYLSEFIYDEFGLSVKIEYAAVVATWSITPNNADKARESFKNTDTYGLRWDTCTSDDKYREEYLTALDLIEAAANLRTIRVRRRAWSGAPYAQDGPLTTDAIQKQQALLQAYSDWVASSPVRVREIEQAYNRQFNSFVPRTYSGDHLTFPGMSPFWRDTIRKYQRDAVAHGLVGNLLVGHEVGLGKTLIAIATIMERRRLKLSLKPFFIVKKATLGQIGRTFKSIYPGAKLLIASPDDVAIGKRQLFAARAMAGDYDCVIMTHEMYTQYSLKLEAVRGYIGNEIDRIEQAMDELCPEGDQPLRTTAMKNLERSKNRLEAKLEALVDSQDAGITFEDIGCDYVVADEADAYLSAPVTTKMEGVLGLSTNCSDRATDFFMKADYLAKHQPNGSLMVLTGTLISNGLHQIYIWMKMIQPPVLKAMGVHCLDAWMSLFARTSTRYEVRPTGLHEVVTRLTEFVNLPELMGAFLLNADIKRYEQVVDQGGISRPLPKVKNIYCPMSDEQQEYMLQIVERAVAVRRRKPFKLRKEDGSMGDDNLLWISTHARHACLDMRSLGDGDAPNPIGGKVERSARQILRFYRRFNADKATQLVLCDLSSPSNKNWSIYRALKQTLIDGGIPAHEIAFVQDCKGDDERNALYQKVNDGVVRVLMGATESLGVGVNVQSRLIALHNLDCPWRPRDLVQRVGRMVRCGNRYRKAFVMNYITQGYRSNCGFDAFMWQIIEGKQGPIQQFMRMDRTLRRLVDDGGDNPVFSPAQIKALATGDVRIVKQVELTAEVERLGGMLSTTRRALRILGDTGYESIHQVEEDIAKAEARVQKVDGIGVDAGRAYASMLNGEVPSLRLFERSDYPDLKTLFKTVEQYLRNPIANPEVKIYHKKIGIVLNFSLVIAFEYIKVGEEIRIHQRKAYLVDVENTYHEFPCLLDPNEFRSRMQTEFLKISEIPRRRREGIASLQQRLTEMRADQAAKQSLLEQLQLEYAQASGDLAALDAELSAEDEPMQPAPVDPTNAVIEDAGAFSIE